MVPVFRHFSLRASLLRLALVAAACAAVAGAPARAENLEQAFALALNADGRLSASTRHVAAARSAHAAARGLRQPQVSVDALYYHLSEQRSFSVEILSVSTTLPIAQDRGWLYRAGVSVPLYTSSRIDRTEQAAQAGLDAAELGVQRTEQDIRLDVAHAYIGVLRAQRQHELAASGVETLEAHGRDAASFFEQGLVARNDMLAARSAVANARQDLIRATTMLDIARAGYNRQLGRALDDAVSIDELPQAKDNNASPVAAGSPRAELLALTRQAQALRHQAAAARAATRPQLAFSAGYDRLQNRYLDKDGSWNIGVGMHWSLFDGSISDNQADGLKARADALAHQRDDLESRIALQVRAAELMVAESRSRIGVAETAIEQADAVTRKARAAAAQSGRDAGRLDELAARGSVPQQRAELARLAAQSSEADVTASEQARIRAHKLAEQAHLGDDKVRAKADEIAALESGLAQAEAARAELLTVRADLTIRSPISGVVVARIRSAGEVIAAGSPILDVVDLDRVYLKGYVPESQIGRLRLGLWRFRRQFD